MRVNIDSFEFLLVLGAIPFSGKKNVKKGAVYDFMLLSARG